MTSAQVVETSVTNNSSSQNYPRPDDHTIRTTDTPGFKPFTGTVTGQLISAAYFMQQHDLRPCAQYAEKSSYSKLENNPKQIRSLIGLKPCFYLTIRL